MRNKAITFVLTEEEKKIIESASKRLGQGHSSFSRAAALEKAQLTLKALSN